MRTLSRYFVVRYLGLFAAILVGASLALSTVELLLGFDDITDPTRLLAQALVRVPSYYLRDLAPIAAFFAAFFTIGLAVRWLEWTAVQAAGISPWRVALPLLATAVLLAALIGVLRETVVPRLVERYDATRRPSDEDLLFRAGSFWYQKGSTIYSIGAADKTTGTLRNVEVFERTARGRLRSNFLAEEVIVRPDGSWLLRNAVVRQFTPDAPERPTEVHVVPALVLALGESSTILMEQTDAAALSLPQLIEYVSAHEGDDHPGSRAALRRLDLHVQQRISEPWMVVAFTLLALPLALRVRPGGSLAPAGVGAVGVLGAFFLARNLGYGLAGRGILPITSAVWLVPVAFAGAAMLALWLGARSGRG